MLFQIPETMPIEHYRPDMGILGLLNFLLFIVFTGIFIIFGIYFLFEAKKQEVESVKRIKRCIGLFGIFYGICRIFFILMFQPFTNPSQNYNLFANIAYSFGMLGFISIIWGLESAKYEHHYFFMIGAAITAITIAGVFLILFGIAEIRETILIIIMIGSPVAGLFILILYVQLIRLSTGIVKKKAFYSLLGFFIMVVGITLDGQFVLAMDFIPLFVKMVVVPLICIIGILIFVVNNI